MRIDKQSAPRPFLLAGCWPPAWGNKGSGGGELHQPIVQQKDLGVCCCEQVYFVSEVGYIRAFLGYGQKGLIGHSSKWTGRADWSCTRSLFRQGEPWTPTCVQGHSPDTLCRQRQSHGSPARRGGPQVCTKLRMATIITVLSNRNSLQKILIGFYKGGSFLLIPAVVV